MAHPKGSKSEGSTDFFMAPIFVSVKQASQILGISPWSCYKLLDEQQIESRYMGRRRLVVVESMQAYAKRLPNLPQSDAS